MNPYLFEAIKNIIPSDRITAASPMSEHTTFKVGGPADMLISVADIAELGRLMFFLKTEKADYMILGNGSNLLVSDKGYNGIVIRLAGEFEKITVSGNTVTAGAGAMLSRVCRTAMENSLSGLEFAYGIPGTVGGAMVMNAGAYGGEMKDVVTEVSVLLPGKGTSTLGTDRLGFGYRDSVFKHEELIALETVFTLRPGDKETVLAAMNECMDKRKSKQPLEYPSAGSTFKRPEGYFAGKLIEDAGLKGLRVGGACVSEKHSGFIVNDRGASAADINRLIGLVTEKVKEASGVTLEPEVIRIGEF